MRRDVFQAIADPTRREIIDLLAGDPLPVNAIAEQFPISRPAISKHLKILHECGLVRSVSKGRERHCILNPQGLQHVADWVEPHRKRWEAKLDQFETYLNHLQSNTQADE